MFRDWESRECLKTCDCKSSAWYQMEAWVLLGDNTSCSKSRDSAGYWGLFRGQWWRRSLELIFGFFSMSARHTYNGTGFWSDTLDENCWMSWDFAFTWDWEINVELIRHGDYQPPCVSRRRYFIEAKAKLVVLGCEKEQFGPASTTKGG